MAWTDPRSPGVGELVDADYMNEQVRDNFLALYEAPVCRLEHSTTQSKNQGETTLSMDTALDDDEGMWSNQRDIDFSRTGVWWLTGYVQFADDPDGYRYARIGGIVKQFGKIAGGVAFGISLGGIEYYTDAQTVNLKVAHSAGGNLTISARPQLAAQWLGAG